MAKKRTKKNSRRPSVNAVRTEIVRRLDADLEKAMEQWRENVLPTLTKEK